MSVHSYGSGQRGYFPKVSRQLSSSSQHSDSRPSSFTSIASTITPYQWSETLDPLDYEDFMMEHAAANERDPLKMQLTFPADDLHICIIPRPSRTLIPVIPPEPLEALNSRVRDCVRIYTSPWLMIQRRYQQFSSNSWARQPAAARIAALKSTPRQEFETDGDGDDHVDDPEGSNRTSMASSRASTLTSETPRGSWASFDLRQTVSDALLPSLLDRLAPEAVDLANKNRRLEIKQDNLFSLYPLQDEEDMIERRLPAEAPAEHNGQRLLIKCTQLKLELEIEPIYASMALYDVKERKKVSENFYFDLNDDAIKRMMDTHVPYQDYSTLSRTSIFQVTYPSTDLFLVIKLEKVLQGDISDCAEPYIKDDKNREKVRANAVACCERLGKYRMPFAWTGIHLHSILAGVNNQERDRNSSFLDKEPSLSESSGANSLDRKSSTSSFEQFRRRAEATGSWSRRGSLERRSTNEAKRNSWSSEDAAFAASLENFRPVTLTVSSFFKQEGDRLRDEDLFKYLQELRKSSAALKRLKCIPGTLKLEVSPCPEDVKYCLTSELARLHPFPDEKMRPTKELVEFPPRDVFVPHFTYRNLYFVYPKSLNFTNRPGSARNIAVKIQFMCGENEQDAMPVIFGKSSCPEFTTEAFTAVTYHNKCPDFYDEIKIKLPANLKDCHHLLFTFYHVSCQKKTEQSAVPETVVGYSWLPVLKDGSLQTGEFNLPVMLDPPPPNYLYIGPEVMLPGTRWVDNHKGIFNIVIDPATSVHTLDRCLDRFLDNCAAVEENNISSRIGEARMESELRQSIVDLCNAKTEPLVKFLPLVMDKLISLMTKPPVLAGQQLNLGPSCFEAMASVIRCLSDGLDHLNDHHGRNSLLATYIHYQACVSQDHSLPFQQQQQRPMSVPPQRRHSRSTSQPEVHSVAGDSAADAEVGGYFSRGVDRSCSLRAGPETPGSRYLQKKLLHEEIAFQWRMCSSAVRDIVFSNAWFFFELIVKNAVEHLASTQQLDSPRKYRFSEQFLDDISHLVSTVTTEIVVRQQQRDGKDTACLLNLQLAFFLHDVLSVMDRGFVFSLIRSYCRQLTEDKSHHSANFHLYMSLKLDFLRVVCSHEHFVALNLPYATSAAPGTGSSPPSPSPSVASSASQSSFVSTLVSAGPGASFAELTPEFCQKHFLVGLVLSEISAVLEVQNPSLQGRAANLIRNLLTNHDWDPRYIDTLCRARVASLYLPWVGVLLDRLHCLYDWSSEAKGRPMGDRHSDDDVFTSSPARGSSIATGENFHRKGTVSAETTRHLLVCFLWVIRNVEETLLRAWWMEMSPQRLQRLLELMFISVSCFEYRGKLAIRRLLLQGQGRGGPDMKAKLEELIRGQGSARSEMMQRRRERNPSPSPHMGYSNDRPALRWRKDQTIRRPGTEFQDKTRMEVEMEAHIEGNLAAQANLAILDALEIIVQVLSQQDSLQGLLPSVLRVLLHMLGSCQSTALLQNAFATQRSLVYKFPGLLFDEETELCADLCLRLLRHCSSSISSIRSQASASLYLLMRQNFEIGNNFARVKMQVTMSLSSLVGTSQTFNEEALRRSLKTILVYAEEDTELQDTTFPEQVQDLVFNLHMILSDTVKMKEFQEDPEMLLDLMYRIAKGYQNSPDLRLTWLANMAQKHSERNNHAEAAMCLVHSAALVAEYLRMLEDRRHLPVGAVSFEKMTPNAIEESAVSDDVLSPDEEGFCSGKYFTENGLVGLLEQAAISFYMAGMYESMNEVYKILKPIAEAHRDYKKLINIHGKLHDAFTKIDQQQGKRVFGTYFRVGFYGSKFGDLDREEFIYKEPTLTKLPEISHRLENFYSERFGASSVVMIKDSNPVDPSKLNPDKAYIQITYVEPYFDVSELRDRITLFEKNNNIKRFIYATPFTVDGRAHGELHEQYKRKTILTTANHFPYVKTRIQVIERKQMVLTPIEVAIEDIQKKTNELASATNQEPPDPKILQMVLQGCIGTTVNQGPMEVANVFLADLATSQLPPTKLQLKLRLCFKDFSKKCSDALKKNKSLIAADQHDYQRELERNYKRFTEKLNPLISIGPAAVGTNNRVRRSRSKQSPMVEAPSME